MIKPTLRIYRPIHLDHATEAAVCLRVAELELSADPVDRLAADALRRHFVLDEVWVEEAKEEIVAGKRRANV